MTLSIDDLFSYLEHLTGMKGLLGELKSERFAEEYEDGQEPSDDLAFLDDPEFSALMFKQIMIAFNGTKAVSARIADIVNEYKQRYKISPECLPVVSIFANAIESRESSRLLKKSFADRRRE